MAYALRPGRFVLDLSRVVEQVSIHANFQTVPFADDRMRAEISVGQHRRSNDDDDDDVPTDAADKVVADICTHIAPVFPTHSLSELMDVVKVVVLPVLDAFFVNAPRWTNILEAGRLCVAAEALGWTFPDGARETVISRWTSEGVPHFVPTKEVADRLRRAALPGGGSETRISKMTKGRIPSPRTRAEYDALVALVDKYRGKF